MCVCNIYIVSFYRFCTLESPDWYRSDETVFRKTIFGGVYDSFKPVAASKSKRSLIWMSFQRPSKRDTTCTMTNKHEKNLRGKWILAKLSKRRETNFQLNLKCGLRTSSVAYNRFTDAFYFIGWSQLMSILRDNRDLQRLRYLLNNYTTNSA